MTAVAVLTLLAVPALAQAGRTCLPKNNTARILTKPAPNAIHPDWMGDSYVGLGWSFAAKRIIADTTGDYGFGDLLSPRGGVVNHDVYVVLSEWDCSPSGTSTTAAEACGFNDCSYFHDKKLILTFPKQEGDDDRIGSVVSYLSSKNEKLVCKRIDQELHEDVYQCNPDTMLMLSYAMYEDGVTEIKESRCATLSSVCWRNLVRKIKGPFTAVRGSAG